MSLLLSSTAALGESGNEAVFDLTAGILLIPDLTEGTGYSTQILIGSISPVVPVDGSDIVAIITWTPPNVDQQVQIILAGGPPQDHWNVLSMSGVFTVGGQRTIVYESANFAFIPGENATWNLDLFPLGDRMLPDNVYACRFEW